MVWVLLRWLAAKQRPDDLVAAKPYPHPFYWGPVCQVTALMEKPEEDLNEEEGRLLELLSLLVEEYEDRVNPLPKTKPHKMLAYLREEKGMKPRDLWPVLPKSRVSEILSGKRGISKAQVKQLSELLRVPAELFL